MSGWNAAGGILVYVRDDNPCKLILMLNTTIKVFFIQFKARKKKWFLYCSYNPQTEFISNYLIDLNLLLTYYDIFLLGDFNVEVENNFLNEFHDLYAMKSLIWVPQGFHHTTKTQQIQSLLSWC